MPGIEDGQTEKHTLQRKEDNNHSKRPSPKLLAKPLLRHMNRVPQHFPFS
jgi:hypothetical protein